MAIAALVTTLAQNAIRASWHDGFMRACLLAQTAFRAIVGDAKTWRNERGATPAKTFTKYLVVAIHHVEVIVVKFTPCTMQNQHHGFGILLDVVVCNGKLRIRFDELIRFFG